MWGLLSGSEGILKKGQYKLNTRLGVIVGCHQCTRLIKTYPVDIFSSDADLGRPIIERLWTKPHRCVFTMLRCIQQLYDDKWMDKKLFDQWMGLNTCDYQLGANDKLLDLWKDRKEAVKANSKKGHLRVKKKQGTSEDRTNEPNCPALKYSTCLRGYPHRHASINWSKIKGRATIKAINEVFPWSSDADKSHTNVDVASLVFWALKQGEKSRSHLKNRIDIALSMIPIGSYNITACAWLIALCGLSEVEKLVALVKGDGACGLDREHYPKYWKSVSTALRRTSRWENGDLASLKDVVACSYMELPIGRSNNVSDWDEERDKRTKRVVHLKIPDIPGTPDIETNRHYVAKLGAVLDDIMLELINYSDVWPSWMEMVLKRQSWVSAGSSGGARMYVDGKLERVNKQAYFESVEKEEMLKWPTSEPKIDAVGSEKFEMGKSRAIYGTKPIDYAIMSYVIASSERKLWRVQGVESGLSGLDEVMCIVRRSHLATTQDVECTMIDYADFNYQHTLEVQSALFEAMSRRLRRINAQPDLILCCDWCADAMRNQWCLFPNGKKSLRITHGMFSGCRGTNFINTILNVAYMRMAMLEVKRLLHLDPVGLYNIHQGDDVWISNMSRLWAASVYLVLQRTGLIFQPAKQMFDRQRGEFLRVVYTKEGARGYPMRAVGSLIVNPVQSTEIHAPQDKASALTSQIHLLYRRGVSEACCKWLWDAVVKHALSLRLPNGAGVAIPVGVAAAANSVGGLDLGAPGLMGVVQQPIPILPQFRVNTTPLERAIPMHMAGDWISYMSSQIKEEIAVDRVKEGLHQANVSGSVRTVDKMSGLRRYEKDLKDWVGGLQYRTGARWAQLSTSIREGVMISASFYGKLQLFKEPMSKKNGWERRGVIDCILGAVASGPFRDINTVQQAMNMGIVEATKYAILLSASSVLRGEAMGAIGAIERACGKEVLARILSGVGGLSKPWEALFNPIILSWASKCAADLAVYDTIGKGFKTSSQWDAELDMKRQIVLHMLVEDGLLSSLSHF